MSIEIKIIILISVFIGLFVIREILLKFLDKIVKKTQTEIDDVIFNIFKKSSILVILLITLYIASKFLELPEHHSKIIDKSFSSVLIFTISVIIANILSELFKFYVRKNNLLSAPTGIINFLIKSLVIILGIITILDIWGIPVNHFITALGIGGLAVSLALQPVLSNFFSGLNIIASKQIKIGDFVKLQTGEEGYVHDITWMNTVIKTMQNNFLIVPNSTLANSIVLNYFMPEPEILEIIPVSVSYNSDLNKVKDITLKVAKYIQENEEEAVKDYQPKIFFTNFGDSGIEFNVVLRVKDRTVRAELRDKFIMKLFEEYNKEKIEIPYPTRTVLLKNIEN